MAKYQALRGVCIGVDRHVTPKDAPFELDAGAAQFLTSIGAVSVVEETPAPAPAPADLPAPAAGQAEPEKPTKDAKASKKGT
jgi:hypothetical protein